jgi:hypothetical protein
MHKGEWARAKHFRSNFLPPQVLILPPQRKISGYGPGVHHRKKNQKSKVGGGRRSPPSPKYATDINIFDADRELAAQCATGVTNRQWLTDKSTDSNNPGGAASIIIAPIKQRADKPHLLFHGAQSTLNSAISFETMRSVRKEETSYSGGWACGRAYGGKWGHGRGESGRTPPLIQWRIKHLIFCTMLHSVRLVWHTYRSIETRSTDHRPPG